MFTFEQLYDLKPKVDSTLGFLHKLENKTKLEKLRYLIILAVLKYKPITKI